MTWIYTLNAISCAVACIGLTFAIGADWRNIRPLWRAVLIAGTVEQSTLLYGTWEAAASDVAIEARQVLFGLSVFALAVATILALVMSWWSGELTSPDPRRSPRD